MGIKDVLIFTLLAVVAPVLLVLGIGKGLFAFFDWVYWRRVKIETRGMEVAGRDGALIRVGDMVEVLGSGSGTVFIIDGEKITVKLTNGGLFYGHANRFKLAPRKTACVSTHGCV